MKPILPLLAALALAGCAPVWEGDIAVQVQLHIDAISEKLGPPSSFAVIDGHRIYRWSRGNPPHDGCVLVYLVDENDRTMDYSYDGVPAVCATFAADLRKPRPQPVSPASL